MLSGPEEPWRSQKEGGVEVGGSEGSYRHSRPKQGPLQCSRLLETGKTRRRANGHHDASLFPYTAEIYHPPQFSSTGFAFML